MQRARVRGKGREGSIYKFDTYHHPWTIPLSGKILSLFPTARLPDARYPMVG